MLTISLGDRLKRILLAVFLTAVFPFDSSAAEFGFRFDLLGGGAIQDPLANSVWNPGNQAYQFSESYLFGEIRPDFEVRFGDSIRVVARPRLKGMLQSKPEIIGLEGETQLKDAYVNEAYVEAIPFDSLILVAGRQNYQWGPAESINPTSFFFPDLTYRVEPFYEFRGRNMARANLSLGDSWSVILLGELPPASDEHLETGNIPEDIFDERFAVKAEYAWGEGAHNIGLVAGRRKIDRNENLFGAYSMVTASSAWQLYADVLVTEGSPTLLLTGNPVEPLAATRTSGYYPTGVAGVRYTFEGGAEWRWEWIFNRNGYTSREYRDLKTLIAVNPLVIEYWASRQTFPLIGENYLYSSIRQTSQSTWLGFFRQPILSLRVLWAMGDDSGFLSGSWEWGVGDSGTCYLYAGVAMGEPDSELRRALDRVAGVAYRLSLW
ncbi:MAG: hypothetical protein ABL958_20270 [Bdellovibrionia bacterium]